MSFHRPIMPPRDALNRAFYLPRLPREYYQGDAVCFYIAANPVRAELISKKQVWPFMGCVIPGYPKLNPAGKDFWAKFWGIDGKLRQSAASNIKRPPMG